MRQHFCIFSNNMLNLVSVKTHNFSQQKNGKMVWYDSLIIFLCILLLWNVQKTMMDIKDRYQIFISLSWGEFLSAENLDKLSSRVSKPISPYLRHVARSLEWKSLIRNRFQRLKEHAEIPCSQRPITVLTLVHFIFRLTGRS